jgi:hypothetical protein
VSNVTTEIFNKFLILKRSFMHTFSYRILVIMLLIVMRTNTADSTDRNRNEDPHVTIDMTKEIARTSIVPQKHWTEKAKHWFASGAAIGGNAGCAVGSIAALIVLTTGYSDSALSLFSAGGICMLAGVGGMFVGIPLGALTGLTTAYCAKCTNKNHHSHQNNRNDRNEEQTEADVRTAYYNRDIATQLQSESGASSKSVSHKSADSTTTEAPSEHDTASSVDDGSDDCR